MDVDEWVAAYRDGAGLAEIARKHGVAPSTVRRNIEGRVAIRKRGHTRPSLRKLGPEWDNLGRVPDAELAKHLGCSRQNVAKVRKARGIPSFTERKKRDGGATDTD